MGFQVDSGSKTEKSDEIFSSWLRVLDGAVPGPETRPGLAEIPAELFGDTLFKLVSAEAMYGAFATYCGPPVEFTRH